MGSLQDIICKSHVFYNVNKKVFEDEKSLILDFETINEPLIVMDTLDSCYSHAILDRCFPIFWIIDDLLQTGKIADKNVRIFIRAKNVLQFPAQNLPLIDEVAQMYKGVYNEIINLITKRPVLFEHALKNSYFFKNVIFYPEFDKWQRTPWNCADNYPGRMVPQNEIRFSDHIIYEKLNLFRNMVLAKITVDGNRYYENNLIIIDRKYNRTIESGKLHNLVQEAKKNRGWKFTGVTVLEDKTFQEQVELFSQHRIFIFRHGSCLINLLWVPNNSTVVELEGGPNGVKSPKVIPRICKLTNSKHILLNYNEYDCKKDIFDVLV